MPKQLPFLRAALFSLGAVAAACPLLAAAQNAPVANAVANTPYAIGAQRNGVSKCIGRINQVTTFLTTNTTNSGMVFNAPGNDVNQKLVSTVIEVQVQSGGASFVSASYAPGTNNGECSATYDAVTHWPAACKQVASANFGAFKSTEALNKTILTLDGGPFVKVFLMPAGTGCVSIKKEVLY